MLQSDLVGALSMPFPYLRYFVFEFNLIKVEELAPLQQLIDKLFQEDKRKHK